MKFSTPSLLTLAGTTAFTATTMLAVVPSSSVVVSAEMLFCQIEADFDFDVDDGVKPDVPTKPELQAMGLDLLETFQDAFVNNPDIDMLYDNFERFSMKRIKKPIVAHADAGDATTVVVGADDVANLVLDGVDVDVDAVVSSKDSPVYLRGGNDNDKADDVDDAAALDEEDALDLEQRNRRRKPSNNKRPRKSSYRGSYTVRGAYCRLCTDDDRLASHSIITNNSTINGVQDTAGMIMSLEDALSTTEEQHDWEDKWCNKLRRKFASSSHCYISVSHCTDADGNVATAADIASSHDSNQVDGFAHYLVSDLRGNSDDSNDSTDENDDSTTVYTVQALNDDQASSVLLGAATVDDLTAVNAE